MWASCSALVPPHDEGHPIQPNLQFNKQWSDHSCGPVPLVAIRPSLARCSFDGLLSSPSPCPLPLPVPSSSRLTDNTTHQQQQQQQQHTVAYTVAYTLASGDMLFFSGVRESWSTYLPPSQLPRLTPPLTCALPRLHGCRDPAGYGAALLPHCRRPGTASLIGKRGDGHREVVRKASSAPQCPSRMGYETHRGPLSRRSARPAFPVRWALGITKHMPWASSPFRQPWSKGYIRNSGRDLATGLQTRARRGAGKFTSGPQLPESLRAPHYPEGAPTQWLTWSLTA